MQTEPDMVSGARRGSIFSQEMVANPFPIFAQLRAQGAIVPLPGNSWTGKSRTWIVTRLEDAVQVLKDKRFTVDATTVYPDIGVFGQRRNDTLQSPSFLSFRSMVSVDGADHTRLRTLVSKAFTPRYIETLRPRIQQLADELLDKVLDQGTMDLVHDYAYPLPINVISEMLGVPHENRDRIREWSGSVAGNGTEGREERFAKMSAFAEYVMQLVAEKRKNPQDDLISQLIQIEEAGDRLDEAELLAMVSLLIFAGHETTSNLIGIGTLMLMDHPDQLAMLKADPSLIPSAVEELLRYNGPVLHPAPRFAAEDVEIAGQQIHKGDVILVSLASANRDEREFTDPDDLEIARSLNRHIAFGQGIHYCLGAPLARLEGKIAFTTLLHRMPNLRLNIPRDEVQWRGSMSLRGLLSLPVAF